MKSRYYFTYDDIKISYITSGAQTKTLLFIHGGGGSARDWLPQFGNPELSSDYRLIAVDLPGHGESGWSKNNSRIYRPSSLAKIIGTLVNQLQLTDFILIGLSLGTSVIGEIISPLTGCKGIVLVSPIIINRHIIPADILTPGPFGHVIVAENPSENDLTAYIDTHLANQTIADQYKNSYRSTDPAFRRELGLLMAEGDWSDEVANLLAWKVPMTIVFGNNDSLLKTDYIAQQVPDWKEMIISVNDAGHMINMEQPEIFNQILIDFAKDRFK